MFNTGIMFSVHWHAYSSTYVVYNNLCVYYYTMNVCTCLPYPTLQPALYIPDPIDLTHEDDALQKALALSLQEMQQTGPQISLEDQELSR